MKALCNTIALCLAALPAALVAQRPASPVADALRESLQESRRNLVEAAEEMPADKYGFKPTPAQMTFGEMVLHVAGGTTFLCSTIAGKERPSWPKLAPTAPQDTLVGRLKASFDFCGTALAALDDTKLGEPVPFFGGQQVSRATAILSTVDDWADHYSQAAIYMRLNGLLPPTARRQ